MFPVNTCHTNYQFRDYETIILHKHFNNTYPLAAKLAVNVINSCDNVASWLEKDVNGVSNSGAKGSPNTSGKKDP